MQDRGGTTGADAAGCMEMAVKARCKPFQQRARRQAWASRTETSHTGGTRSTAAASSADLVCAGAGGALECCQLGRTVTRTMDRAASCMSGSMTFPARRGRHDLS